ncbi:MAG: penicillin-binding protein 2 [Tetrasphaera sp.]|nr:penicillin-binding protein 2 [Tetrasphaera sp.]
MLVASLVVFSVFGAQLVRLQAVDASSPANLALSTRTVHEIEPAMRGDILDADGTVLATTIERRNVGVDQQSVTKYKKTIGKKTVTVGVAGAAADLSPLLGQDVATLTRKMTGQSRYYLLAKDISPLTWQTIAALGIPGISSERTSVRRYPQATTAASLVGFVGVDLKGKGGVESIEDSALLGRAGNLWYEVGQDGVRLPNGKTTEQPAQRGRDVRLTINTDLQWQAQNRLAQAIQYYGATSGTVIVQQVKTGKLLAVASYPTFDPNHITSGSNLANLAFTEVFEPGSTAKVMTAAAVLEEGKATPQTPMIVPYSLHRSDGTFSDSHEHPTEYLTFAGALAQSSNTGIILAGEQLSPATLEKYFRGFGVGSYSGVDFPFESRGLFAKSADWSGSQRYTIMYGQGVTIVAIQAASVYQTIANHGVRITPSLVDATSDSKGSMVAAPSPAQTRVISSKAANDLSQMLEGVVSKDGTAPEAKIDGYRVAGKTGTAYRYNQRTGGYAGYTASFIGYAPAEDPELVVSVIIQNPTRNGFYGGALAAPVFHDVMNYDLRRLEIPPSPLDSTPPTLTLKLDSPPSLDDPAVLADRRSTAGG